MNVRSSAVRMASTMPTWFMAASSASASLGAYVWGMMSERRTQTKPMCSQYVYETQNDQPCLKKDRRYLAERQKVSLDYRAQRRHQWGSRKGGQADWIAVWVDRYILCESFYKRNGSRYCRRNIICVWYDVKINFLMLISIRKYHTCHIYSCQRLLAFACGFSTWIFSRMHEDQVLKLDR